MAMLLLLLKYVSNDLHEEISSIDTYLVMFTNISKQVTYLQLSLWLLYVQCNKIHLEENIILMAKQS
jgi:hypothetical protein